jgi:hypothetical protein
MNRNYTYSNESDDWFVLADMEVIKTNISLKDVIKGFKPEDIIESIGIEKSQQIIRSLKLNKIKEEIKKK